MKTKVIPFIVSLIAIICLSGCSSSTDFEHDFTDFPDKITIQVGYAYDIIKVPSGTYLFPVIEWESDDPSVAIVTYTAIYGRKPGETNIRIIMSDKKVRTVHVTVKAPQL